MPAQDTGGQWSQAKVEAVAKHNEAVLEGAEAQQNAIENKGGHIDSNGQVQGLDNGIEEGEEFPADEFGGEDLDLDDGEGTARMGPQVSDSQINEALAGSGKGQGRGGQGVGARPRGGGGISL